MEKTSNKEIINLLDPLSESDSDISDLVFAPRKKKVKRVRQGVRAKQSSSCNCSRSQSRIVSLWLAAVLITFWLIALSWLAAVLYSEIGRIDVSIRSELDDARVSAAEATNTSSGRDGETQSIIENLAHLPSRAKRNRSSCAFPLPGLLSRTLHETSCDNDRYLIKFYQEK